MNRNLVEMLNVIKSNNYDRFVINRFLLYYDKIEQMTISELECRNMENSIAGLKVLVILKPNETQYKIALERLQNRDMLLSVMEKSGLSKSSPIFQKHYADLFKSINLM